MIIPITAPPRELAFLEQVQVSKAAAMGQSNPVQALLEDTLLVTCYNGVRREDDLVMSDV